MLGRLLPMEHWSHNNITSICEYAEYGGLLNNSLPWYIIEITYVFLETSCNTLLSTIKMDFLNHKRNLRSIFELPIGSLVSCK